MPNGPSVGVGPCRRMPQAGAPGRTNAGEATTSLFRMPDRQGIRRRKPGLVKSAISPWRPGRLGRLAHEDNVQFLSNTDIVPSFGDHVLGTRTTFWSDVPTAIRIAPARASIQASLTVLSDTLSAADLQVMIGLAPDQSWERGDPIGRPGRAFRRFSGWSLRDAPSEEPPASHVSALLDRIAAAKENIATVAGDPRVHSVSLWVWSEGRDFGLDLPPTCLGDIAALGAALKIDVYDGDEEVSLLRFAIRRLMGRTATQPRDNDDAAGHE